MEKLFIGLVSALIGVWIGHRFTIGRDKRHEYNAAVRPFKVRLLSHHEDLLSSSCIESPLEVAELKPLRLHFGDKLYFALGDLIHEYKETIEASGSFESGPFVSLVTYSDLERQQLAEIVNKIESRIKLK